MATLGGKDTQFVLEWVCNGCGVVQGDLVVAERHVRSLLRAGSDGWGIRGRHGVWWRPSSGHHRHQRQEHTARLQSRAGGKFRGWPETIGMVMPGVGLANAREACEGVI